MEDWMSKAILEMLNFRYKKWPGKEKPEVLSINNCRYLPFPGKNVCSIIDFYEEHLVPRTEVFHLTLT